MPFLQCIRLGIKKAECRVVSPYIKKFKIGENLLLQSKREFALCRIVYLNFYKDFETMISDEGVYNLIPFAKDEKDALQIYKGFPGASRVTINGCCAIGVKWIKGVLEAVSVEKFLRGDLIK